MLIIGPRGLQCETNLYEIMGWESSDVVRFDQIMGWESFEVVKFDLGTLLQGQTNLGVVITLLLLVLEVCNVKPAYMKSWAGNLLMLSDLTLDPSFKVK